MSENNHVIDMLTLFRSVALLAVLLMTGAGCAGQGSLESRVAGYMEERKECVDAARASFDLVIDGHVIEWDQSRENAEEYRCSTVDLARKYYAEDPEGMVELCVRTNHISGYTDRLDDSASAAAGRTPNEEELADLRALCESVIVRMVE